MRSGTLTPHQRPASRGMRLDTSLRLRWMAIAGQAAAVVFTVQGLGFDLALAPLAAAIAASATLNVALSLRKRGAARLPNRLSTGLLTFDVAQLAWLLYFTGGLQNPFSILFLVPVVVSASTLPLRHTVRLSLLTLVLTTLLAFYHHPLPWSELDAFRPPALYIAGLWTALTLGLAFTVTSVWRTAQENRTLSDALAATELVLQREQHLTRLDGLAAAAAHELGTPLATIALTAKELSREVVDPLQKDDVRLIVEQAARCRAILSKLSSLDDEGDVIGRLRLANLINEVIEPHTDAGPEIRVVLPPGPHPDVVRNAGLLYGLGNLVENAVDYAESAVVVSGRWDEDGVTVTVKDDGPGFSPDVLRRIGEPYLGEPYRATSRRARGAGGLGLGFFIAKTLLERSGAQVRIRNDGGAEVVVHWPAGMFRMPGLDTPARHPDAAADLPSMPRSSV